MSYRLDLCNVHEYPFLHTRNEYGLEFFKFLLPEIYPKLVDLDIRVCFVCEGIKFP